MAWFRHHYYCEACTCSWLAEGDAVIEADCLYCRALDVAPYRSEDRAEAEPSKPAAKRFVVLQGSKAAAPPRHRMLKKLPGREKAKARASR